MILFPKNNPDWHCELTLWCGQKETNPSTKRESSGLHNHWNFHLVEYSSSIFLNNQGSVYLYHCTLYRPLPLDTRPPSPILAVNAILSQRTHANRKQGLCYKEDLTICMTLLKSFIPNDRISKAVMSSEYRKSSGCETHLPHIAKELGEVDTFHLQNNTHAIVRKDGRSFRINPIILLQSLGVVF